MSGLSKFTHPKSFPFNGSTFEFFDLTYKFIWFIKVQVNNNMKFNHLLTKIVPTKSILFANSLIQDRKEE